MMKIELLDDNTFVVESNDSSETGRTQLDTLYGLLLKNLPAAKGGYLNSNTFKVEL